MKKIDYDTLQQSVDIIHQKLFQFRLKYDLTDASLWDVIHTYWYCKKHSTGISNSMLVTLRYGSQTCYRFLVNRKILLIKKGIVYTSERKNYLTEHIYNELQAIFNVRTALPHCPKPAKSRRTISA